MHEGQFYGNGPAGEAWGPAVRALYSVYFYRNRPPVVRRYNVFKKYIALWFFMQRKHTHTHTHTDPVLLTVIRTNASIVDVAALKSISAISRKKKATSCFHHLHLNRDEVYLEHKTYLKYHTRASVLIKKKKSNSAFCDFFFKGNSICTSLTHAKQKRLIITIWIAYLY